MFKIIPFSIRYLENLSKLNRSLVNNWFSFENGFLNKIPSTWEKLTPYERFGHGGPWNDLQTLKIHVREFLEFGNIDLLVMSENDQIVGEIEYHKSNNQLHIDWMMIHPKFQNQGLGKSLITHLSNICKKQGIKKIKTEAEEGSIQFYQKCGFTSQQSEYIVSKYIVSKVTQNVRWEDYYGSLKGTKIGEAMYDLTYLSFLINTSNLYAKIFGIDHPVKCLKESNGYYIKRCNPFFKSESLLCYIIENGQTETSIEQIFHKAIEKSKPDEILYVTMSDYLVKDWFINKRIPNFQLIL